MASLKWACIALMALLSLAICSAHRVQSSTFSMPEAKSIDEPDPRILDDISEPGLVWNGHTHGGGGGARGGGWGGGLPGFGGGYGHGSGSGGGGGGGGGWTSGAIPGAGGGYGHGSGSGGGSSGGGGGGGGGSGSYGAPGFGGNDGGGGGGYGYGGGSGGDGGYVPPGFDIPGRIPFHCQPITCSNSYGCPGFTLYLTHHAPTSSGMTQNVMHDIEEHDNHFEGAPAPESG